MATPHRRPPEPTPLLLADVRTVQQVVASKLREAITSGAFAPGERIHQEQLAEQLGVSRTPVREALNVLAAEGLVQIAPNRGALVTSLSITELRERYFVRELLEPPAAREGAPRLSDAELERVRALHDAMTRSEDDLPAWIELDRRFHLTIYAAGHPRLVDLIAQLRSEVERYVRRYLRVPENVEQTRDRHRQIYDACRARDGDLAERYTRLHLQETAATYEAELRRQGILEEQPPRSVGTPLAPPAAGQVGAGLALPAAASAGPPGTTRPVSPEAAGRASPTPTGAADRTSGIPTEGRSP